jgi:putative ABC transport system ATP-binding protein
MGEDKLHVLIDIDLEIKKGDYYAVLGPSGSGKSTLMNIIGCMDKFESGEYFLDEMPIHNYNDRQLTKVRNSKIGFVFQKYQLIPKYNILQNVIMPLLIRGMDKDEATETAMETVKLLGIDERLHHKPSELSGGQQQRVAIARAIVGKPSLLLADEPTGALDSNTGKEVLKLFKELNEMGNTIIIITHDQNVANAAKNIINIVDGKMCS